MGDVEEGEEPATKVGGDMMTDEDLAKALEDLSGKEDTEEVQELLKMMNENRMISWEEAEQILATAGPSAVVKSGLPQHTRPSEPENETDVHDCISRLAKNDPTLQEVNINNMKRTPIPEIQKLIYGLQGNTFCKKLSMANVGLTDTGAEPLLEVLKENDTLEHLNMETNYLSGEFLVKLFEALLEQQTLQELKLYNQSMNFATESEVKMGQLIAENRGLTKCSINFRRPEPRTKIENTLIRNGEIRRILRRQEEQKRKASGGLPPNFKNALKDADKGKKDDKKKEDKKEPVVDKKESKKEPKKDTKKEEKKPLDKKPAASSVSGVAAKPNAKPSALALAGKKAPPKK